MIQPTASDYYLTDIGRNIIKRLYLEVDELDSLLTDFSARFEELKNEITELHEEFPLPHMDNFSDECEVIDDSISNLNSALEGIFEPIFCLYHGANIAEHLKLNEASE